MDNKLNWLDRALATVEKYKVVTIAKALILLVVVSIFFCVINNPTAIFERYEQWQQQQHLAKIEHRLKNNEKIHILTEKLLYKVNADRIIVLELHNGLSSNSGLPFAKASATYEALNDGIIPVADYYQDLNLSLMPFATELLQKNYWCGNTEELQQIDRALCYKMLGNETAHFAGIVVNGVDKPLAFILVKFKNIDDKHNCESIKKILEEHVLQYALLLELNKQ